MNVYIVVPAYNEEKNIGMVLDNIMQYYKNIVVVDDGSSDRTYEIALSKGVEAVKHEVNRGQGAALQTGNEYALLRGADIIIHFDSDNQMQASEIENMINPIINQNVDVVLGTRFLSQNSNIPWTKKYLIIKPAIYLNWLFSGLKLTDAHNGFRALSSYAAENIKLEQDKMAHATEILELIKQNNLKYCEVPVTINYHEYGQGFAGGIRIIRDLVFGKLIK